MPDKQPNQRPLFEDSIPPMPEGYYSSGLNPHLRDFVEKYSKLYVPEADEYNVPAFNQQITIEKRKSASMDLHIYWSKKHHEAIAQYVQHYTEPGDILLDPFCGSGGTALAALVQGRAAIAIDLSPAATFITKNYCTPRDVEKLRSAFRRLEDEARAEIEQLYETRCDRCDGRAITGYTVYSHRFQCPRCLELVPLFDCVEVEAQTRGGKPKTITACPHCYRRGQVEEISTRSKRHEPVPVLVSYLCQDGCNPERAEREHNDRDLKKREYFNKYDLAKIQELETQKIPYWYPQHQMMNTESESQPWGDKWRAGTSSFRTVSELYTKRNLWASAVIRHYASQSDERDALLFILNTALLTVSKMCRHDWPSVMSGTYYLPPISRELNVWDNFAGRFNRKAEGMQEITRSIAQAPRLLISTQSATDLGNIPANSVDYIFTDPPYADKVQYGELNFVWEAWLDFDTHWHDDEIIVNQTRGKTDADWAQMMKLALSECYRVLKPGRWLSLCYHDTSEGTWQLVQDLMAEVGFISEEVDTALYIDSTQKSYNQYTADKVTKRDLVINFRKPQPDEVPGEIILLGTEDKPTFREKARLILRQALDDHPGSPADRLYDTLVSRAVREGIFERHDFDEVLREVAEEVGGRWYLLETAGEVDAAESAKEERAAARLEAFMHRYLETNTTEQGVHYSDLFEQYLPIADKPRRLLADWLPEFFFKTEAGTWRPPRDDEERQQKATLRSSGTLRRVKRFGNALLEGVPPAERDRPENVATAADWLRQCRRAGLYAIGRALYEKGGFDFATLGEAERLEVEEDYQICVRRAG